MRLDCTLCLNTCFCCCWICGCSFDDWFRCWTHRWFFSTQLGLASTLSLTKQRLGWRLRGRGPFGKGLTKGFQTMSKMACAVSLDRNMYTCTRTFVHECYHWIQGCGYQLYIVSQIASCSSCRFPSDHFRLQDVLFQADPIFIIMENFFCIFFLAELIIRLDSRVLPLPEALRSITKPDLPLSFKHVACLACAMNLQWSRAQEIGLGSSRRPFTLSRTFGFWRTFF